MVKKLTITISGLLVGLVIYAQLGAIGTNLPNIDNLDTQGLLSGGQLEIDNIDYGYLRNDKLHLNTDESAIATYKYDYQGKIKILNEYGIGISRENPMGYTVNQPKPEIVDKPNTNPINGNGKEIPINPEFNAYSTKISNHTIFDYETFTKFLIEQEVELGYPVDEDKMILTSDFGLRIDPFEKTQAFHTGLDISNGKMEGENIYAIYDAEVVDVIIGDNGYGNHVILNHGGFESYYAHMTEPKEGLEKGDIVLKGEVIGYVGNTGRSTGPHLHFEIDVDGVKLDPKIVSSLYNIKEGGK